MCGLSFYVFLLLFDVCCLLCVVWCHLLVTCFRVVRCSLFLAVRCVLIVVCSLLSVACRLFFEV